MTTSIVALLVMGIIFLMLAGIVVWGIIVLISNPIVQAVSVLIAMAAIVGLLKRTSGD